MIVPTVFNVGATTAVPSVGVVYQLTFCPGIGVIAETALSVCIGDCSHCVILPFETGAVGAGFIVNVTGVLVSEGQVPSLDSG